MLVDIITKKLVNIVGLNIQLKVADQFGCTFVNEEGQFVKEYEGYVPPFFPGKHFGDYVYLHIDIETGQILNWKTPTADEISDLFEE